ncbi:long-chain-acyl-CoA synthetase [Yimella sp. cx-51]|uniref:long-chain-acyl-CoA synthetase n=1 Tax=Yimella sp. cx-51 TaxID=2770551 RepID=UPI00165E1577|nr:long-chain-acyl-CoA synthetase [Yimella sp. cx-51]MBC9955585.1 long-chain-acyl-CoA synthetase [Yimella sp. cx-51]QTH37839.1 long-chain-acyl-CoA synthetase [Yimella sp. cx-51]
MSSTTRRRVGLTDVAKGLMGFTPDLPMLMREAPGLLLRKPDHHASMGQQFQLTAARHPDRPFLKGAGRELTYRQANELANQYADLFRERGVGPGDVVGVNSPNDVENILVILAVVKLGAVAGLINYNQRHEVLAHSLRTLDARLIVMADELDDDFASAGEIAQEQQVIRYSELAGLAEARPTDDPESCAKVQAKDRALLIFTSGTTGLPKASVMTHFRWLKSYSGLGALGVRLRPTDTLYCALPLYHNNAVTVGLGAVLAGGAALAVSPKFSASKFWDECRAYDATAFVYIGELCRFLLAQPGKPDDRDNTIRVIVGNGLRPDIWDDFQQRFGIERIAEFYGASECNIAFINAFNVNQTAGTCPLPYKVVDYDPETGKALRDKKGRLTQVKTGEVGLLISKVTDRAPFDGYTDAEASEKKLLRDGFKDGDCWFDTGDLVRNQGLTHVAFVDRLGDTFRWKGENVATTEVEAALAGSAQVVESTVYGVEVPGCDGKAGMAAVVLPDGEAFDGAELAEHVRSQLPAYARPLFVRLVNELEHTSTFKSRKVELRNLGFADGDEAVYVLTKDEGYVPIYDGYTDAIVAGTAG